jgi:hypothetical protein
LSLNLTLKIKKFSFEEVPGDVKIVVTCFLADNGVPFVDATTGAIDTFDVQTAKTSLPAPAGVANYLSLLTASVIEETYGLTQPGVTGDLSDIVEGLTSTTDVYPSMTVSGSNIPVDTTVLGVRDSTSIRISAPATGSGAVTLTLSTTGWTIDYSAFATLATKVNFGAL